MYTKTIRWGPYLQSCQWGFSTLEAQGSISYGQYLDRTFGKFPPLYGTHLYRPGKITGQAVLGTHQ